MLKRLIAIISLNLLPALVAAQAYGEGNYGQSTYSSGTIHIGPVTLPVTGPQLAITLVSTALIAAAVTLVVWYRRHKKRLKASS